MEALPGDAYLYVARNDESNDTSSFEATARSDRGCEF